ncbi:MAG: NAD(P)-dependent oxidoreductase, partial [Actinomycetes bacterium]
AESPYVEVIEASLLSLSNEELQRNLGGCDAAISCLGHVLSLKGVLGPPRDLVARATARLCRAIVAMEPEDPIKPALSR